MYLDIKTDAPRINARAQDAFDIFDIRHYLGPNPYLETAALVFDFAIAGNGDPLALEDYLSRIAEEYPHLAEQNYDSYAHLFARSAVEVGKLDMGLHLNRSSVTLSENVARIALQTLHAKTQRAVVYTVWDWFEAITQNEAFDLEVRIRDLQERFRVSVYGGPTVYALLKAACDRHIPAFYLWDERLMQYGYGRKLVRGSATTFDGDSHLDSDFTMLKDDCKAFLHTLGFPVPQGSVVTSEKEALAVAERIGYPVAVKPVIGHKGIGVTADVRDASELSFAYEKALAAIAADQPQTIIVEQSIKGVDYRLLCVNGRFVAATERRPAFILGNGHSTIAELIERENNRPERKDTPTSPLGKIKIDDAMEMYLREQNLSQDSILERDRTVYLRKVANLSSGGMSIDATGNIHPDNIILAQDVAQHFRLTCLGIDVIAPTLAQSWKSGNLAILEINAAPGISMHLRPAVGESVDVPARILSSFFESGQAARIPTITFNRISVQELQQTIDHILFQHPDWVIGAVCRDAIFVNRSEKVLHPDYNLNVQNLLRNPKLDLLIAQYDSQTLERDGMFYYGSNLIVLNNPTETELMLERDIFEDSTVVLREGDNILIRRQGLIEQYPLSATESFTRVFLKEIATLL
jgi:cyanophycin synthetase